MTRQERQDFLKRNWYFDCHCDACENDYPMYQYIRNKELKLPFTADDVHKINAFDKPFIRKYVLTLYDYLQKNEKHYPCDELYVVQSTYRSCLRILMTDRLPLILNQISDSNPNELAKELPKELRNTLNEMSETTTDNG